MKTRLTIISTFLIMLVTSFSHTAQAERPDDFGKQWVRKHPLTIMGLTQSAKQFDFNEYKDVGMNSLLAWKRPLELMGKVTEPDFPVHVSFHDSELSDDLKSRIKGVREATAGSLGILVRDEPQTFAMPGVAKIVDWIRTTSPETLVYTNAYPKGATGRKYYGKEPGKPYGYDDYLNDFMAIIKPDILMFDIYPFRGESGLSYVYFSNLKDIREKAIEAGIPYWLFVQSAPTPGTRFPSDSELRMQIFSALAYGFTGIAYFTYDVAFARGLLEPDGSPNYLYYAAARINREVQHLGQALRFLTCEDIKVVQGHHIKEGRTVENPLPYGTKPWEPATGKQWQIRDVKVIDPGQDRNALIGLFRDDDGQKYFMVVNLSSGPEATADEHPLTIHLELAPTVKNVARLSRETGTVERISLEKTTLKLTLPSGTGDLFRIGDGSFPGL